MNENLQKGENVPSPSIEDLLGFLNSPIQDLVEEVKTVIKEQFSKVSDKWLINGLLDYFFRTKSKRVIDLLISAPEPHSKYMLEKISTGVKGNEKFQYLSFLLYAVSQNPPPIWIQKKNFLKVIEDVIYYTNPKYDSDISNLVTGVMILVIVLPTMPREMSKFLNKIFQQFWSMIHYTPTNSEENNALKPHLQVAVYYLFHRLYALYPCNLLSYLRMNACGQAKQSYFIKTLTPMLQKVSFHPSLVSETKESELLKSRFIGYEANDMIAEFAKLSFDPIQEVNDSLYTSRENGNQKVEHTRSLDINNASSLETSFWSPAGVGQSPSPVTKSSAPATPFYTVQSGSNPAFGIAESPPENAIEATPETTPYPSPMPLISPSPLHFEIKSKLPLSNDPKVKMNLTSALESVCSIKGSANTVVPLSPQLQQTFSFAQPSKMTQDSSNLIASKLQKIQLERTDSPDVETVPTIPKLQTPTKKRRAGASTPPVIKEFEIQKSVEDLNDPLSSRLDGELSQEEAQVDFDEENEGKFLDPKGEGLGTPSETSMKDLMNSVKTKRLRFLSQCGPPPNINFSPRSPSTANISPLSSLKQKSNSYPALNQLAGAGFPSNQGNCLLNLPPKDFLSVSRSPTQICSETSEMSTQTEEVPIVNPYENLLDVLTSSNNCTPMSKVNPQLVDLLSQFGKNGVPIEMNSLMSCSNEKVNVNESKNNLVMQLKMMHALAILEKTKRIMHSDRNRRLLSKIKKLNYLQEKDAANIKEKSVMKNEYSLIKKDLDKVQEALLVYQNKHNNTVDKSKYLSLEATEEIICQNREQLRANCAVYAEENTKLGKDLQNYRGSVIEYERQLEAHSKHKVENVRLHKKVAQLDQKLVLMGEIQMEMQEQARLEKIKQKRSMSTPAKKENARLSGVIENLEAANVKESTSKEAYKQRVKLLEDLLKRKEKENSSLRKKAVSRQKSNEEKIDNLRRENKELHQKIRKDAIQTDEIVLCRSLRTDCDDSSHRRPKGLRTENGSALYDHTPSSLAGDGHGEERYIAIKTKASPDYFYAHI